MTTNRILLDPTSERAPAGRQHAPRPDALDGLTIGLLDISKARGDVFIDQLAGQMEARGLTVRRYRKPTYTRVAPDPLRQQIATECDVVVEALAD